MGKLLLIFTFGLATTAAFGATTKGIVCENEKKINGHLWAESEGGLDTETIITKALRIVPSTESGKYRLEVSNYEQIIVAEYEVPKLSDEDLAALARVEKSEKLKKDYVLADKLDCSFDGFIAYCYSQTNSKKKINTFSTEVRNTRRLDWHRALSYQPKTVATEDTKFLINFMGSPTSENYLKSNPALKQIIENGMDFGTCKLITEE